MGRGHQIDHPAPPPSRKNYPQKDQSFRVRTTTLRPSLCDYCDVYILVKGTIKTIEQRAYDRAKAENINEKEVIFKNCALFTSCISEIRI